MAQRASIVLFTRKIAESGEFNDELVEMIWNLRYSKDELVLKAIGWGLKDMMRSDQDRTLRLLQKLRNSGIAGIVTSYALKDFEKGNRQRILSDLKNDAY